MFKFGIFKHYPYICSTNKKPTQIQHGTTHSALFKTRRDKGRGDKDEAEEDNFKGGN